jgi:hypothetical protein
LPLPITVPDCAELAHLADRPACREAEAWHESRIPRIPGLMSLTPRCLRDDDCRSRRDYPDGSIHAKLRPGSRRGEADPEVEPRPRRSAGRELASGLPLCRSGSLGLKPPHFFAAVWNAGAYGLIPGR